MSNILAPVGFRYGTVFALNSAGLIDATDEVTPYEGLEFKGPKAYNITIPPTRKIVHTGRDRVLVNDQLPTLEATAGEIRVSSLDFDLDALLSNVKVFSVGNATMVARNTDQQGYEPDVGLLLYQQSKDMVTGLRNWHFHIIPVTQLVPIPSAWGDNPEDHRYEIAPTPSTKHLWGTSLGAATEGATEGGVFDGFMAGTPKFCGWLADGIVTVFTLPSTALNTSYVVHVDGVLDATPTQTVDDITYVTPPAANSIVTVFYAEA